MEGTLGRTHLFGSLCTVLSILSCANTIFTGIWMNLFFRFRGVCLGVRTVVWVRQIKHSL